MSFEKGLAEFPLNWEQLWEVFHQARGTKQPERAAYLEHLNQDLRSQILELLEADEKSGEMLENIVAQELNLLQESDESEPQLILPDEMLAGRFRIMRQIGKGGMGTVYEALDQELGTSVALKMMRSDLALDSSARERFHREINLARQITHPNACRIFDLFRHEDLLFLTMELLEGETLHERIQRDGRMHPSAAMPIVQQVCEALAAIHRSGIVHRDLKTSNILLVPHENGLRAVVTDFGLAITLPGRGSLHVTETGQVLGTPEFMAPEQLKKEPITGATDVYALGLVLYEMVTGELPQSGESPLTIAAKRISEDAPSPRMIVPDLERRWERTILRCLERNPKHRFQSAAEVSVALRDESITTRLRVLPFRHRTRVLFATVISLIGLLLAFLFWQRNFAPRPNPRSDVVAKRLWTGGTGLPATLLSTDGRILIDVDWQSADLMAIELATGEKRRLTNSGVWFVPHDFSPYPVTTSLSHDGKKVAYSMAHLWDSGCDLRTVSIRGSTPRTLYSSENACANPVDWSSDGQQILAIFHNKDGTARIALVSSRDGIVRPLKSLDSAHVRKMNLSQDNRYIIYDYPQEKGSADHDVFLLSVIDGAETRVVNHKANDYVLGWAPGGERIVFASDRAGTHDAWILDLSDGKPLGAPKIARKDVGQIFPLKLTPEGSLYYSHLMTSNDIYTATVNLEKSISSSPPLKILHGVVGSNTNADFSPDGKYLMFQTVKYPLATRWSYSPPTVLKILSLQTDEERNFSHELNATNYRLRWSRDGRSILIHGNEEDKGSGLYKIDVETGKASSLIRDPHNNWVRKYSWSSESGSIFYMLNKGGKILLRNFTTGQEKRVYSGAADFDVSADGRWLAVLSVDIHKGITFMKILSAAGGEAREILKLQMPEWIPALAWTADGHLIYAEGRRDLIDQPHGLWSVSMHGGKPQELGIVTEYVHDLRVHPDGRRVAVSTVIDTSEVWVMENFLPRLSAKE